MSAIAEKPRKKRVSAFSHRKVDPAYYWMTVPAMILFMVFLYWPFLRGVMYSFTNSKGYGKYKWIGLTNYKAMFQDERIGRAYLFTFFIAIVVTILVNLLSMFIAVLLNSKIKGIVVYRTAFFFPYVASLVAVGAVWNMLFQPEFGPINEFLKFIGVANPPKWCASTDWAMTVIIIVSVWKYMGYYMVVYLAALQGISQDLYEAASIDGATGFKKFRYITIPMLKPTTFFVIIMMTIQCFKVFDLIYVMTGGGPGRSTNVLVNHIYNAAFVDFKFGYASASALVLFAIVLVVTLVQFQGEKKFTDYV